MVRRYNTLPDPKPTSLWIAFSIIPYSRKYWQTLNLAVWSQAAEIKILADLNLAVALRSVIRHYSGSVDSLLLEVDLLEQSREFANNWQHVNDELAICTACEKGRRTGPRALQHVLYLTHCGRSQHNIGGF